MAPCMLPSSISLGGVWQASEKRVLSLYWRYSFSETGLPAPYIADYLKRMSEWWRKVVTERETEQKLFCFGIRMCYFPARAPVESLRGWTAVSSHLYTLFTFKNPKALMNHTFQENQKTNILWKLSQKWWCHIWCMKMDSQIHSKTCILCWCEDHIRRWPWKASFARPCWIYNRLSSVLQTLYRHCQRSFISPYGS